jgi:predicted unusual protein kinase regulating ubiquinone biosynthesis (AarF/ABC1/UbiB family)
MLPSTPQVTSGPYEGKLALLDFGLVAEIPSSDRQSMVSATIHLANRDWDALIGDFVDLGFLPRWVGERRSGGRPLKPEVRWF